MYMNAIFEGHPLHLSALLGLACRTREDLERGEDPNKLYIGKSPLHFAMGLGVLMEEEVYTLPDISSRIEVANILLDYGALIDSRDSAGRTPLMSSIRSNNMDNAELAKFLLEKGADPLLQDKDGHTPFHHACDYKRPNTFALLLKYGPSVTDFPVGKDRRTLLHLAALCSQDVFEDILESSTVDYINTTCSVVAEEKTDEMLSLPCCLMQNRNLQGIKALLSKEGICKSVLTCPVVSQLCRGVYSPVAFAFVKDTYTDFSLQTVHMYLEHNLPLDPDFSYEMTSSFRDVDICTCLEILADVHEFHLSNNLHNDCRCAQLFIVLLQNGARVEPYNSSSNILVSNRVLKFLFTSGSIFGLMHLLNCTNTLEPHIILKSLISMIATSTRHTLNKNGYKAVKFLVTLSSPDEISAIRNDFVGQYPPALRRILNYLTYEPICFPSLKSLSRIAVRKQCRNDCEQQFKLFNDYVAELPLPRALITYIQFGDLVASLELLPGYPSFSVNLTHGFLNDA